MKSGESSNSTGTGLVIKLELLHKGYWYNGTMVQTEYVSATWELLHDYIQGNSHNTILSRMTKTQQPLINSLIQRDVI